MLVVLHGFGWLASVTAATVAGAFLFPVVLLDRLVHQIARQAGFAACLLQQVEQVRVLVLVDFHNNLDHVFSLPVNF